MRVRVKDDEGFVEDCECEEVRLPSGEHGVIWRGLAYPLVGHGEIRVDGVAYSPAACSANLLAHEAGLPETSVPRFAIIDGDDECYVLIQGSVVEAEASAARMKLAGLTVRRHGRYLGDPVDGLIGDWFIRIVKPEDGDWRALVAQALDIGTVTIQPTRETVAMRCRLLEAELATARAEIKKLHDRVSGLGLQLAEAEGRSQTEIESLVTALEEERRQLALAANMTASEASLRSEVTGSKTQPRKLQDEVASIFKALLPRIELIRDAETFILTELETRTHLYRALSELTPSDDRMPPNWKKLKGLPRWWERHVSTGRSDAGRIYVCLDRATNQWLTLVSHKGDQSQDIVWLSRAG